MAGRLKATLAQRPLAAFFVLAGVTYVALVCVAVVGPLDWINHLSRLCFVTVGLAALVCCWAVSGPPDRRPRRLMQLFIVIAVALLMMGLGLILTWLDWRWARSLVPVSSSISAGFPTLASLIGRDLANTTNWLVAVSSGLVFASVVSPCSEVRRTSRALVSWRAPRTGRLAAVALLVVAICIVAAWIGAHLAAATGGEPGPYIHSTAHAAASFASALLLYALFVFAWYGFVAERLAGRMSPLVIGLLIGLALAIPVQLAFWIDFAVSGLGLAWNHWTALGIGGDLALGVLGVWLARRALSLLPTLVLYAAFGAGTTIAMWTSSTGPRQESAREVYALAVMAVAVVFVVVGRMWRRPDAGATSSATDAGPAPRGYDVAVRDVGTPL